MVFVARRMRLKVLSRFALGSSSFEVGSSRLTGAVLAQRGILGHLLGVRQICSNSSPGLIRHLIPRVSLRWCRLARQLCGASFA